MLESLEVVHEDPILRQAYLGNLHLCVWFDAPTLDQMRAYGRAARELSARFEGKSALVNGIVSGIPRFTGDVRDRVNSYTRRGHRLAAAAHVITIDGLVGTAARAFMNTALLVSRPSYPSKLFAEFAPASRWITEQLPPDGPRAPSSGEILEACLSLSRR